jgi:hypothetical protein
MVYHFGFCRTQDGVDIGRGHIDDDGKRDSCFTCYI